MHAYTHICIGIKIHRHAYRYIYTGYINIYIYIYTSTDGRLWDFCSTDGRWAVLPLRCAARCVTVGRLPGACLRDICRDAALCCAAVYGVIQPEACPCEKGMVKMNAGGGVDAVSGMGKSMCEALAVI